MKICPLVTQAYILEDTENEVLIREADDNVMPAEVGEDGNKAEKDDIFLNPDDQEESLEAVAAAERYANGSHEESAETSENYANGSAEAVEAAETAGGGAKESNEKPRQDSGGKTVRVTAKSFRGEVECLGGLCRFHDDEKGVCRFEALLSGAPPSGGGLEEELRSVRAELEMAWDFQKQGAADMLGFFREMQEKNEKAQEDIRAAFGERIGELKALFSSISEENKTIIESIADTLAEKTGELDDRLKTGDRKIDDFKSEVSNWKGGLDRNMETLEKGLNENTKLVRELSENNSRVMKVVENQKESREQEEKKRQLAEARRLNNAGVMNYHNGQYEKALEMFGRAIAIDGNFTEAYNNLGLTYTEMDDEEKATEAFKKAIELKPELGATYNNLGYVFYRMGSYHEAIEMYNEAIGRSSDNSSAWTNLGNACYKLDRIEEALNAWNKALEIDPGGEEATRMLILALAVVVLDMQRQ